MSTKTPAQILMEIGAKCGTAPQFEFENIGTVHAPKFQCICKLSNYNSKTYSTVSVAGNKQSAKQLAAELMIKNELQISLASPEAIEVLLDTPQTKVSDMKYTTEKANIKLDEITETVRSGNPIGDILAMCEVEHLPTPIYREDPMIGQPHDPIFVVYCALGNIEFSGISRKKQTSKRIAADKVFRALTDLKVNSGLARIKLSAGTTSEEEADMMENFIDAALERPDACGSYLLRRMKQRREETSNSTTDGIIADKQDWEHVQEGFLQLKGGPTLKQLIDASEIIADNNLRDPKPKKQVVEWLQTLEGGSREFFKKLQEELKFKVVVMQPGLIESTKNETGKETEDNPNQTYICSNGMCMVGMTIKFPKENKIKRNPTTLAFGSTRDEALLEAQIDIMTYLAVMCRT